jgi:hypothetical protein
VDLGLRGEQVADQGDRRRLGHREHEHLAGLQRRHGGVDHQVVALRADDGPRWPGDAAPGDDLDEVGVDVADAPAALVDGRAAQAGELFEWRVLGHRALLSYAGRPGSYES